MKKSFLLVLALVMAFSMVMVSCDVPCDVCGAATSADCICNSDANACKLSPEAVAALTAMGFKESDVFCPQGTTFVSYSDISAINSFTAVWKDANQNTFNYYEKRFDALPDRASNFNDKKSAFNTLNIDFNAAAGTITFNGMGKQD